MPKRVSQSSLQANTLTILNTIRANASAEYQSLVPKVEKEVDIPRVGDVLFGYPALANQFLAALVNRIALVVVKSATFNNRYARLKKGYLMTGETVEEVFVQITKAREFSVEKAEERELKRSLPDVRTAFHAMNWRVQYPVTIQDEDLRLAFTSLQGVTDMISRIINAVYTAAEYDEFLLFKYLLIKNVAKGFMHMETFDGTDIKNAAKKFRGLSNKLEFMSTDYNISGVHTTTPKADQVIFMDSTFNAEYDVDVLAAAFNMDKATFMGSLYLIDDFTTFDNERFSAIRAGSDQIDEIYPQELAAMKNIKAIMLDSEWFQVYDNQMKFTEKYVASGEYWNYFLNVWKTVSTSPFSNAIALSSEPVSFTDISALTITDITRAPKYDIITLGIIGDYGWGSTQYNTSGIQFKQTQDATEKGVAVTPYGSITVPVETESVELGLTDTGGNEYTFTLDNISTLSVGGSVSLSKVVK